MLLLTYRPVSYTHLDVYKRQRVKFEKNVKKVITPAKPEE